MKYMPLDEYGWRKTLDRDLSEEFSKGRLNLTFGNGEIYEVSFDYLDTTYGLKRDGSVVIPFKYENNRPDSMKHDELEKCKGAMIRIFEREFDSYLSEEWEEFREDVELYSMGAFKVKRGPFTLYKPRVPDRRTNLEFTTPYGELTLGFTDDGEILTASHKRHDEDVRFGVRRDLEDPDRVYSFPLDPKERNDSNHLMVMNTMNRLSFIFTTLRNFDPSDLEPTFRERLDDAKRRMFFFFFLYRG